MPSMMLSPGPSRSSSRSGSPYALAVFFVLCLSLLAALLLAFSAAAQEQGAPQTGLRSEALSITAADGKVHDFTVEIADTVETRARGLMFYESLAADAGMLFDYHADREVVFWMKNTLVSLDMLFIARDGRIASIAENTEPLSEALVPSNAVVRFVLEVPAGTSARLGIAPGDRVDSPTIRAAAP